MTTREYSRYRLSISCAQCGYYGMTDEFPREINDPFSADNPLDVLNTYQRERLEQIWHRDSIGPRYRRGVWSKCDLRDVIAEWHQTRDKGFFASGAMGTGKTVSMGMMMVCLAARNEFSFTFAHMGELSNFLHQWSDWGDNFARDDRMKRLRSCRYLFLDDLGVEYNSPLSMSRFNELIEVRYSRDLLHIGTSNLSEDALFEREGWGRIIDRIQESALDWVEVGGQSKRRL
jgi:predicted ATPase